MPDPMAANFPPNFDDPERWLPSSFISDVGLGVGAHNRRHFDSRDHIEALANQLAAIRLLDQNPNPIPGPNWTLARANPLPDLAEGLFPMNQFGVGRDGYRVGTGSGPLYLNGSRAVPNFNPAHAQMADGYGQGRSRVVQRQQQLMGRVNGSDRMCRGTGVFLPRVVSNDVKKQKNAASLKEVEPPQTPTRNNGGKQIAKKLPSIHHQSPELSLPQEWTY